MLYEYGKRTRDFFEAFLFFFKVSLLYFGGVFNKTTISYPTRACGIIVKYINMKANFVNLNGDLLILCDRLTKGRLIEV